MHSTFAVLRRLLAATVLLVPSISQAQERRDDVAELERPEVLDVRFRGLKAIRKGDLETSIATKESGCKSLLLRPFCLVTKSHYVYERRYLDREEFSRDVIRLLVVYFKRGYRDARVDTVVAKTRGGVRIAFNVTEGAPTLVTSRIVADS